MAFRLTSAGLALAGLALSACAQTNTGQVRAAFEANLAAHNSATEALRAWCEKRGIAPGAQITARRVQATDAPPPPDLRERLGIGAAEPLGYRHVRLGCGKAVLSQAHNWFVPARLTAEMNRELAESDRPFGRVTASLNFARHRLTSSRRGDPACPAGTILAHRAVLRLPDGQGLALVIECYTRANLGKA